MKKSIIIAGILSAFVLVGNTVLAQDAKVATVESKVMVSKAVETELDASNNAVVVSVNANKDLSEDERKKVIRRFETLLNLAKTKDDKKAKLIYSDEYKRLAAHYARVSGKTLPELKLAAVTD